MSALAPTRLLTASSSAYTAALALDDEAVYALTPSGAIRMVPGRNADRWPLDLGISPLLTEDRLLYWSGGAIRQVDKRGGAPSVLAEVSHQPQRIVASRGHVAWLDRAPDGRFSIWTHERPRPRVVHAPAGYVATLAMQADRVFFVERESPGQWRLGSVALSGGSPRFTAAHSGRTPAMLAVADEVFYYDGPSSTIRRVSLDLEREEVVAREIICSPIAVAKHLYCAQPGKIVELTLDGRVRRELSCPDTVTAIAAGPSRLAWLVDAGQEQMSVDTLQLSPTTGGLP